jgi:hypothetical protein
MSSNMSVADTDSEIKADPEKRRADGNKENVKTLLVLQCLIIDYCKVQ